MVAKVRLLPASTSIALLLHFFFFQAEDGIRDYKVTGVQTCALPISSQLTDRQLNDPRLLLQLLRWQVELCGPNFEMVANNLYLGFRRGVAGLDIKIGRASCRERV